MRSVASRKRLDNLEVRLFACHPGIYLLVKPEAFHPANILREPTESGWSSKLTGWGHQAACPTKTEEPEEIVFGKAFFLGHNARTVNGATTNRRQRADAQSSGPPFCCSQVVLRGA